MNDDEIRDDLGMSGDDSDESTIPHKKDPLDPLSDDEDVLGTGEEEDEDGVAAADDDEEEEY